VYEYDLGRMSAEHELIAGDHCYSCPLQGSVVICAGGNTMFIAIGWQALTYTNSNGTQILPVLTPPGYGQLASSNYPCHKQRDTDL
jgi:hypothetical protein